MQESFTAVGMCSFIVIIIALYLEDLDLDLLLKHFLFADSAKLMLRSFSAGFTQDA